MILWDLMDYLIHPGPSVFHTLHRHSKFIHCFLMSLIWTNKHSTPFLKEHCIDLTVLQLHKKILVDPKLKNQMRFINNYLHRFQIMVVIQKSELNVFINCFIYLFHKQVFIAQKIRIKCSSYKPFYTPISQTCSGSPNNQNWMVFILNQTLVNSWRLNFQSQIVWMKEEEPKIFCTHMHYNNLYCCQITKTFSQSIECTNCATCLWMFSFGMSEGTRPKETPIATAAKILPMNKGWKFVGLAYQGKDIVFRFIIEYSGLRDFSP